MARVLGKVGRHVEEQSAKKHQRLFLLLSIAIAFLMVVVAFYVGFSDTAQHTSIAVASLVAGLVLILILKRYFDMKLDALVRERIKSFKGAVGEALVGYILEDLPDDFVVLNHLTTPVGNIDHVVVGPTGVFVIDTEDWSGVVAADGDGKLLLNGKPAEPKSEVQRLVDTCAETKRTIKSLCNLEPHTQAVLCFTSANVYVPFGSVKDADCVSDERLRDYIADEKNSPKLTKQEIDSVSRACLALAQMDREFKAASVPETR
jgi:hypothetical protein